jgi:predicted PurR-regulated permease PerM
MEIQRQGAVDPVPPREVEGPGATMAPMAGAEVPKTQIPRWIQLVGLPVLLLIGWTVAGAIRHVVFIFLVAALLALLLNPIVRAVGRRWIARGFAVAIVYVSFAALIILLIAAIATAVVSQTRSAANRVDDYFTAETGQPPRTEAERDVDRFQLWLNQHHLKQVKVRKQLNDFVDNVKAKDVEKYTTRVIDFVEGAAIGTVKLLFSLVLVIVISIYMLLYMERLGGAIDRRFPPEPGSPSLLQRVEHALASYVKGQVLLSLIIGTSAGLGLWLLGTTGLLPGGDRYALLFGAFVAFMELIPYIGPWLGAVPPFVYALVVHPLSAVWVALLFLGIHQLEGHVVVPNVMGSALRLNPLLVIFGLLAGGEIYGLPGALVALPLLAAGRATWEFFDGRLVLEPFGREAVVPVGVPAETVPAESDPSAAPRDEAEAAADTETLPAAAPQ